MTQAKFSMAESQIEFLNNHSRFGFKDKSTMVRTALDELKKKLERAELQESANLYAEIYGTDNGLVQLTETAIKGWPEE
jgi:hypothetical protein